LAWCLSPEHKASIGSKLWQQSAKAWKSLVSDTTTHPPATYEEWFGANFWWSSQQQTIGPAFSQSRAAAMHNVGLRRNGDAWNEEYGCFLSS
jgi:hypothetical protein